MQMHKTLIYYTPNKAFINMQCMNKEMYSIINLYDTKYNMHAIHCMCISPLFHVSPNTHSHAFMHTHRHTHTNIHVNLTRLPDLHALYLS